LCHYSKQKKRQFVFFVFVLFDVKSEKESYISLAWQEPVQRQNPRDTFYELDRHQEKYPQDESEHYITKIRKKRNFETLTEKENTNSGPFLDEEDHAQDDRLLQFQPQHQSQQSHTPHYTKTN
jgi:hypothetical protein